jgi:hypothetical protein
MSSIFTMLKTMNQAESPLSHVFFSDFNIRTLQTRIRQDFKTKTGISIDYQDRNELLVIMRACYINNSTDPWSSNISVINDAVVNVAIGQIGNGVGSYISYLQKINSSPSVASLPKNTSTRGQLMNEIRY